MKTKLILLVAAASLVLPAIAGAAVDGPCADCHTMHDSQNGVDVNTGGPNNQLLRGDGCVGCHATTQGNEADGRALDDPRAPQVNDGTNPNAAGFFRDGTQTDDERHNVADFVLEAADAAMVAASATQGPGGTFTLAAGGSPVLKCDSCHSNPTHHNVQGGTYRGLSPLTFQGFQTDDANWGYNAGGEGGLGIGETSGEIYDATAMNLVCAECHADFHGDANQDGTGVLNNDGMWLRHPTDIDVVTGDTDMPSILNSRTYATDTNTVTLGSLDGTSTEGIIMCITCHSPHGSNQPDLLTYLYDATNNLAGGTTPTASDGCEYCHSYGSGM